MSIRNPFILVSLCNCVFILLVLLSFNGEGASAFRCYVCNSNQDASCGLSPPSKRYIKDCDQQQNVKNETYSLCRLMIAEINGKTTVDRRCGWISERKKDNCMNEPKIDLKSTSCECHSELCNAAPSKSLDRLILLVCITTTGLLARVFT